MLLTNMELRIRSGTVGYNNKILVSDENLIWGKMMRSMLAQLNQKRRQQKQMTTIYKVITKAPQPRAPAEKATITHEDEKIATILLLAGGFTVWHMFQ